MDKGIEGGVGRVSKILAMSALDCPRCHQPLQRRSLGALCSRCEGCWLGFDQLDHALRLPGERLECSELEPTLQEGDSVPVEVELPVRCPQCRLRTRRQVYLMDSGVVVDVCREHGMWLDDGELTKMRTYLQATEGQSERLTEASGTSFFRRLFGG